MADAVDRANELAQAQLERSLDKAKLPIANPLTECQDCGDEIGFERKQRVPSATRCVDCQSMHERKIP